MRWRAGFKYFDRKTVGFEVNLKKSKINPISNRTLVRITLWSSTLLLMAVPAFYFEQYGLMGLAIFAAIFLALWQIAFYRYTPQPKSKNSLDVTNFYSKGSLIFVACWWATIIIGVGLFMYFKTQ